MKKDELILKAIHDTVELGPIKGSIVWRHDGPGPYKRKGKEVMTPQIKILGKRMTYSRVVWALLTSQILDRSQVLDKSEGPTDYRKWRVVLLKDVMRQRSTLASTGEFVPISTWIDYKGKSKKLSKPRGKEDDGFDKIDRPEIYKGR